MTKRKNEGAIKEVDELKGQLARALADYDNLRKRVDAEREFVQERANARVVGRVLPILDMLSDAQKHIQDPGLAITIEEFVKAIGEFGVEKIRVEPGQDFDENIHEAVESIETEKKEDDAKIAEVTLGGWKVVNGSVVRPTKVKVFKKK